MLADDHQRRHNGLSSQLELGASLAQSCFWNAVLLGGMRSMTRETSHVRQAYANSLLRAAGLPARHKHKSTAGDFSCPRYIVNDLLAIVLLAAQSAAERAQF